MAPRTLCVVLLMSLIGLHHKGKVHRTSFLVPEIREGDAPHAAPLPGGVSSSWMEAKSLGLGLVLALGVVGAVPRVRRVWRRATLRWSLEDPLRPVSYAATLVNRPSLDFLTRQMEEEESEEEGCRPLFKKVRSLPSRLSAGDSEFSMQSKRREDFGTPVTAPTLLQQRQAPCKGLESSKQEDAFSIPSIQTLHRMFVAHAESPQAAVLRVTRQLNHECQVGFQESDAQQIYRMFSDGQKLSPESFAVQMHELLQSLAACDQLSLHQLRTIMASAFDRFDADEDGVLSIDEFSCALRSFGINLGRAETDLVLRFLAPPCQEEPALEREDLATGGKPEEQLSAAVSGMKEKLMQSTGISKAVHIAWKINDCLEEPGSPKSHAHRLVELCHQELALATDVCLTVAGLAMVVMHHQHLHTDAAPLMEQMKDAADDFQGAFVDLCQPIGAALASGALALAQKDSVKLDVNEALLYARYFLSKGCPQRMFHKLITVANCHWSTVPQGQALRQSRGELRILVKGKAQRGSEVVLPGTMSCEEVLALEDLTFVAWDMTKLRECLESVKDPDLKNLIQQMLQEAASDACDVGPGIVEAPEADPVNAVGAALARQAKQRGLASTSFSSEGLLRILSKPNLTLREKLDQCHATILNCKDDLVESVEALADLAALGSLLVALGNHSATLSPENVLQLTPLLVLLADVASKQRPRSYEAAP